MIKLLQNILYEPYISNVDVNSYNLLKLHKKILTNKKLLRSAFISFYREMILLSNKFINEAGEEIELGSGAGFFKKLRKNLKTSDIRSGHDSDLQIDAQKMNLDSNSIRCIYAINVFHHLQEPEKFLSELCRVLKKGGGAILIEPHNGFFSAFLHKHMHKDERYDANDKNWKNKRITGPLSGANQALSYIVFERDLERFNRLYGKRLSIVYKGYVLNSLRYFFSGGLNFRQLLPSFSEPLLIFFEKIGKPIARHWSLHQIIVIKKI
jgi:SAM-dependent methyltransferase